MFLVLMCLCSLTSSATPTVAVICNKAAAAGTTARTLAVTDCTDATIVTSDIETAFGFAKADATGINCEQTCSVGSLASTITKVILIADATHNFKLTGTLPSTVTYIGIAGSSGGTSTAALAAAIEVTVTLDAKTTVSTLALNNVVLKTTATKTIEVADTLDLQVGASLDATNSISAKERTTTTVSTSVDLAQQNSIIFGTGKITVLKHVIPNTKVHLKIKATATTSVIATATSAIAIKGEPDENSELIVNVTDESTAAVEITLENTIAATPTKIPTLSFIAKDYDALKVTPPATPNTLKYKVLSSGSKSVLLDEFPRESPVAICVGALTCTSKDIYSTATQLYRTYSTVDVKTDEYGFAKSKKITFILQAANTDQTLIDISGYIGASKDITIVADGASVFDGFIEIKTTAPTTAKLLSTTTPDYKINSLTIKNVNTKISSIIETSPITVTTLNLLSGSLDAKYLKVTNDVTIDRSLVDKLKQVTLLKDLIVVIKNPTTEKSLTFNGVGWNFDTIVNVVFAQTGLIKPTGKTIFNIEYDATTAITVKAAKKVDLLPLIIKTIYSAPEPAPAKNLLASDDAKLTITIDKESWLAAQPPPEVDNAKQILVVDANDEDRINFVGKDDMGEYSLKFTVNGEPPGGGGGGSTPKKGGLSAGAIAGIVVGAIAVVAGICIGVFFYLKKSKAKVKGAEP